MQKLYLRCLIAAVQRNIVPYTCKICGFCFGICTQQLVDIVSRVLRISYKFRIHSVLAAFLDIRFAFDAMRRELVSKALLAKGVPASLVAEVMRELLELKGTIYIDGIGETDIFDCTFHLQCCS